MAESCLPSRQGLINDASFPVMFVLRKTHDCPSRCAVFRLTCTNTFCKVQAYLGGIYNQPRISNCRCHQDIERTSIHTASEFPVAGIAAVQLPLASLGSSRPRPCRARYALEERVADQKPAPCATSTYWRHSNLGVQLRNRHPSRLSSSWLARAAVGWPVKQAGKSTASCTKTYSCSTTLL